MYAYLKGIVVESHPTFVILDVNGVGFKIFLSIAAIAELPSIGKKAIIFTSFIVRENAQSLYGFFTTKERDIFELLININGIGPKLALSLIGHMDISDLQKAVSRADAKILSRVPGIGKKTAERLIIEMADKLPAIESAHPSEYTVKGKCDPKFQATKDVVGALVNLGYSQSAALQAAERATEVHSEKGELGLLIREALKLVKT